MSNSTEEAGGGEGGARAALAGFLYEIIGVLGLAVSVETDLAPDDNGEFTSLLRATGDGAVFHEQWGQDAAVLPARIGGRDAGGALIQFKYSLGQPPRNIQPAELKEIADKLSQSARLAAEQGQKISHYALVSNRPLSPKSPNLLARARRGEQIEDVSTAVADTLARLIPLTDKDQSYWSGPLEEFMRRYGADAAERSAAIDTLIGTRVRKVAVAQQGPIALADIIAVLVGSAEARSLDRADTNGVTNAALQGFDDQPGIIEREALTSLSSVVQTRALVAIVGPGGSGKSTALAQWLRRVGEQGDAAFISWMRADQVVSDRPIAEAFTDYMLLQRSPVNWMPNDTRTIQRLQFANPAKGIPILFVALDAADEPGDKADWHRDVERLIREFAQKDARARRLGEPPDATLILTCRKEDDIRSSWLANTFDWPADDEAFERLEVGYFSDGELLIATSCLPPDVGDRVRQILKGELGPNALDTLGRTLAAPVALPANLSLIRQLSHPALWGAFLHLEPPAQNGVLDGGEAALMRLANLFIHQFCIKVGRRRMNGDLTREDLLQVLGEIARACGSEPGVDHDRADWNAALRSVGNISLGRLYRESSGYGIIELVASTRWRWQHEFVHRYLLGL